MKKILFLFVIGIAVTSGIFLRIQSIESSEAVKKKGIETIQKEEGFPVILTDIKNGSFEVWRDIPGRVQGFREAFITTPEPARVAAINYQVGDFVEADTPIISLDENDPKNMSKIKLCRSVYEDSLTDYKRYKHLYESGGVSKGVLDKFELKLKQAKTNLDAAGTTVHLTSPFSGTLTALYAHAGENAEPKKTLAIVSSLEKVRVVAGISDRDVAELKKGQPVNATAPDGTSMTGYVDWISLGANPKSGLFDLEMVIVNPNNYLKTGTYITASVRIFSKERGIFINKRCVLRDFKGKDYIFQSKDNTAVKTLVTITAANDTYALLQDNIPRLPVVRDGHNLLRDGVKVNILTPEEQE